MSFAAESRERAKPILPLAAMVDILFLLLVFFITASTFSSSEPSISVTLTPAEAGEASGAMGSVTVITFTPEGKVFVGDREFTLEQTRAYLQSLYDASPDEPIYIRGDQAGAWGVGVRLLDYAKAAGFESVDLNTLEISPEAE